MNITTQRMLAHSFNNCFFLYNELMGFMNAKPHCLSELSDLGALPFYSSHKSLCTRYVNIRLPGRSWQFRFIIGMSWMEKVGELPTCSSGSQENPSQHLGVSSLEARLSGNSWKVCCQTSSREKNGRWVFFLFLLQWAEPRMRVSHGKCSYAHLTTAFCLLWSCGTHEWKPHLLYR